MSKLCWFWHNDIKAIRLIDHEDVVKNWKDTHKTQVGLIYKLEAENQRLREGITVAISEHDNPNRVVSILQTLLEGGAGS